MATRILRDKKTGKKRINPNDPKWQEEQRSLKKWQRAKAPKSLFERIDSDSNYRIDFDNRQQDGNSSLGTAWGIKKSYRKPKR